MKIQKTFFFLFFFFGGGGGPGGGGRVWWDQGGCERRIELKGGVGLGGHSDVNEELNFFVKIPNIYIYIFFAGGGGGSGWGFRVDVNREVKFL